VIVFNYKQLWKIEDAFGELKGSLKSQTIWVRTDIPENAQNLLKALNMRIPPKIL